METQQDFINYEDIWDVVRSTALQHKEEFIELLKFIHVKGYKNVLEIGSYKGGTALGFLMLGLQVTCIDIDPTPELYKLNDISKSKLVVLKTDSKFINVDQNFPKYDVLFIDGDHTYEGAKGDYERFKDSVNPGGIIVFHDIKPSDGANHYGCADFWQDIKKDKKFVEYSIESSEPMWGGLGVLFV